MVDRAKLMTNRQRIGDGGINRIFGPADGTWDILTLGKLSGDNGGEGVPSPIKPAGLDERLGRPEVAAIL